MTFELPTDVDNISVPRVDSGDSWLSSRSGARAGRGFHYQDLVGAWLTARMFSRLLNASRIVPEGYEDLSCEGGEAWQVQVKSRQERVGEFSAREVALFIAEMWNKHLRRASCQSNAVLLALVLERPISGLRFDEWGLRLSAHADGEGIARALRLVAEDQRWPDGTVALIAQSLTVLVLPWEEAAEEIRHQVCSVRDIYPVAADMVGRAFREAIAQSADKNASAQTAGQSAGIDLSQAAGIADEVVGLVDRAALDDAIADGLCEVINYTGAGNASEFFEGVSAQPWHITAGLPAPRPDIVGAVVTGLDRSSAVLLTGPSGVGKSTALWATTYATRDVLWYRVRRLDIDSVARLIRLARASMPTARSKVGFVFDGIGIGSAAGWDDLLRESAQIPGVILLGSARTEDLLPIRTLAECAVVEVGLDEAVAERIFAKLKSTGRTDAVHWREAFEDANGLTLEFTYFLTRGRRLRDVLTEQVRRRVDEGRDTELRLLALASTAHRWGATLQIDFLQAELDVAPGDFRSALGRLKDEHLVLVGASGVSGLHQVRSALISSGVHRFPPPTLEQTLEALVKRADRVFLSGLLVGALADFPELETDLLQFALERIREDPSPEILAAVLGGLRISDFQRKSRHWVGVMDRHSVSLPLRPVAFQLAMLDDIGGLDLKPGIADAIAEIKPDLNGSSRLCSEIIQSIGVNVVGDILGSSTRTDHATSLMSMLGESPDVLDFSGVTWSATPLAEVLRSATAVDYGNLIEAARSINVDVAMSFSETAGGDIGAIDRLMRHCSWLTEFRVDRAAAASVAIARTLHISDEFQGDADAYTRDFARIVLRCFADCESVDVQALRPGGLSAGIGDHPMAHSMLKRQYDHSDQAIAWNRQRAAIAVATFGNAGTGRTDRAALATQVVELLADYIGDLTQVWITSRNRPADVRRLNGKRSRILELTQSIAPASRGELATGLQQNVLGNDHLHSLADGIVDNFTPRLLQPESNLAALAVFVGDSLREYARAVGETEEWALLDTGPPSGLASIDATLQSAHAILSELAHGTTPVRRLIEAARSGRSESALDRAAEVARRAANGRHDQRWAAVRQRLVDSGLNVELLAKENATASATEWPPTQVAIGLHVRSVQDWTTRFEQVRETLTPPSGDAYNPRLMVIPLVNRRPVVSLSQQVISTFLPAESQYDEWANLFLEGYKTPLSESMAKAHSSLVALSGLGLLSTMRETAGLQGLAEEMQGRFAEGMQAIEDLDPRDAPVAAVLEYLGEVAVRVQTELDNAAAQIPVEDSLCVTMTKGVMLSLSGTPPTDLVDFNVFSFVSVLCLEYDIDPPTAGVLLQSALSE
jgi:hypothetical protein